MIAYRAVPYLLIAAPPAILLLTILISGCTMARTSDNTVTRARVDSNPDSKAGQELVKELDRRAVSKALRRVSEAAER